VFRRRLEQRIFYVAYFISWRIFLRVPRPLFKHSLSPKQQILCVWKPNKHISRASTSN